MIELKVKGMTCGGCAATVRTAVAEAAPSARIEIEVASGTLRVDGDADESRVRAAIAKAGYGVL